MNELKDMPEVGVRDAGGGSDGDGLIELTWEGDCMSEFGWARVGGHF